MQTESKTTNESAMLKYKVMVIDTAVLKSILMDKDVDGITFTFSQAVRKFGDNNHSLRLVAYKHFSGRKSEEISNPDFFVKSESPEAYHNVEIGDKGITTHFGNLKLRRDDLNVDIDTNDYPYLFLWPTHGDDEYDGYIEYKVFYSSGLDASLDGPKTLSRGFSANMLALKNLNPSPPA